MPWKQERVVPGIFLQSLQYFSLIIIAITRIESAVDWILHAFEFLMTLRTDVSYCRRT